jgi:hypothetical protein
MEMVRAKRVGVLSLKIRCHLPMTYIAGFFPIHEIGRIDGGRGFRTGRNVLRIGGNTFYNRKNKIPIKILEFKRSGIGIIAEFCGIITLDTFADDDGMTILGWHCGYCLILGNRGGSRFFNHRNASKALSHLTKGKDIVTCTSLWHIPANVVYALTALMYSKANRKHDIAVQKNNLHEEVEQQQDRVLGARIDR